MRALVYDSFKGPLVVRDVAEPVAPRHGVVVTVEATGVCRSDWHGWQGHDADITTFPHVPGHELAGTISAVGEDVTRWTVGDRVTAPFVNACGTCPQCDEGEHQVCVRQTQPGFTRWGSFAEQVVIDQADINVVALPDGLDMVTAASLGCRYATSFRAVRQIAKVQAGEWVVVHGCGGVGLAAVQIAAALGARVIAIDISPEALALASGLGAQETLLGPDVAARVHELTGGGAHVSIDALGSVATAEDSVACLRPRGRHVQIGLLLTGLPTIPMGRVLGQELQLLGSHGMSALGYPELLELVVSGALDPARLVTRTLPLEQAGRALEDVGLLPGVAIITFPRATSRES